jgi:predicted dehydrogenase
VIPVAIVGLGRIGAGNVGLAGDLPLSHLAALRAVDGLAPVALVDADATARAALPRDHPGIAPAMVMAGLDEVGTLDGGIAVLATPPAGRASLLAEVLQRKPKVVIVEKPLALDIAEARSMVAAAERAGAALRVNFHRRFDARHRRWRALAPKSPRAIALRYGKGLFNYASHMVDLLMDWYGPVAEVRALGPVPIGASDPNPGFVCRMAAGFDAVAMGVDGLDYDLFEIDILGSDSRVEMRAGGAEIHRYVPVQDLHYRGYRHLAEREDERDIGPVGGFVELYEAARDHIAEGAPLGGCDGRSALANMAVLDAVLRSAAAGGAAVTPAHSLPCAA